MTRLLAAGHIAAWTLVGVTVHHDVTDSGTSAAAPDTPLHQPDPPWQAKAEGTVFLDG
ncbi:hypothetical protein ACIQ6Y_37345 [Streptomyces sp. NPDC096205]|uniref:hypothetical protein n=1 Tax=Streptomyces sp. NPDC096205 TaxID=3366081 RepID=UPI0037FC4875